MRFRNLGSDVEPKTQTTQTVLISAMERLEQARHGLGGDLLSSIRHGKIELSVLNHGLHNDGLRGVPMRDGVAQQIGEHLRNARVVDVHSFREVETRLYLSIRMASLNLVDDLRQHRLNPLVLGSRQSDTAAQSTPGEGHHVVDQTAHPVYALAHQAQYADGFRIGVYVRQDAPTKIIDEDILPAQFAMTARAPVSVVRSASRTVLG